MTDARTIPDAARLKGISESAMRSRVRRGRVAVVHKGGRGRGNKTLVDVSATTEHQRLVASLPDKLAEALFDLHCRITHPRKADELAELVAASWYVCAAAALEHFDAGELPTEHPEKIRHLRSISRQRRTVPSIKPAEIPDA